MPAKEIPITKGMDPQEKTKEFSIYIDRLSSLMSSKSLSQSALARITGIRQATISDYLKGNSIPSAERFSLIADALGVSMDYLWGKETGETEPSSTECPQRESIANPIFISRMNELLKNTGLSQNELGRMSNISQATISSYLKGRTAPKSGELSRLSDFFGVSMDYLWGRSEAQTPITPKTSTGSTEWQERALQAEKKLIQLKALLNGLGGDVQTLGNTVNKLVNFIAE